MTKRRDQRILPCTSKTAYKRKHVWAKGKICLGCGKTKAELTVKREQ